MVGSLHPSVSFSAAQGFQHGLEPEIGRVRASIVFGHDIDPFARSAENIISILPVSSAVRLRILGAGVSLKNF